MDPLQHFNNSGFPDLNIRNLGRTLFITKYPINKLIKIILNKIKIKNSATGTRTRVSRVRVSYPDHLDYCGFQYFDWAKMKSHKLKLIRNYNILMKKISSTENIWLMAKATKEIIGKNSKIVLFDSKV